MPKNGAQSLLQILEGSCLHVTLHSTESVCYTLESLYTGWLVR